MLVTFCVLGGLHLHRLSYDTTFGWALLNRVLLASLALIGVFCKESAVEKPKARWSINSIWPTP